MNVVFLSPAFPPTAPAFCTALAELGVTVLGIGDEPLRPGSAEARALSAYIFEPQMSDHRLLREAAKQLERRFGAIDRIDSNGEHWLKAEARLRDELGVPGLDSATLMRQLSKLSMAELFGGAGIPYPPVLACSDSAAVECFAAKHGFPLVFKPEQGSGAVDTFAVSGEAELQTALKRGLSGHLVQPFIDGDIVTYDGLCDRLGRIVFSTCHVYDAGIMQVRQGRLDGHYISLRQFPTGVEDMGRRAVAAFDVRERFFHLELFRRSDDSLVALEMNLRPPGGFTTDLMGYACELDVYRLWASVLTGRDLNTFEFERKYHTAHAGRRTGRCYRLDREELVRQLGDTLVAERAIPAAFADTMGDTAYLLRHGDLAALKHAIELVHAT